MNFKDILNLFKQGKATAKSHLRNLIEIAAADGGFGEEEQRLLEYLALRNNISKKELAAIQEDTSNIPFEIPKNQPERFSQFYDLVHMMYVDRNVTSEELKLCELFAMKFGYRKEAIREMIETIRVNIENWIGPKETMELVSRSIKIYN